MKNPLVQIVILNWNGYLLTKDCLDSLKKVGYSNFKVMVVDNASSDNSHQLLSQEYDWVDVVGAGKNLGFAGGNNFGVNLSQQKYNPDFFVLLNNDTIVEESFLNHMVAAAQKDKEVGMVTCKMYYYDYPTTLWFAGGRIDKRKGEGEHIGYDKLDAEEYSSDLEIDFITGCCAMISKETIQKIGLLDEVFFAYCEDLDYSLRCAKHGIKMMYAAQAKLWHRVSASFQKEGNQKNIGKRSAFTYYLNVRNRIYVFRKHHSMFNPLSSFLYQVYHHSKYFVGFIFTLQGKRAMMVLKGVYDGIVNPLPKASHG